MPPIRRILLLKLASMGDLIHLLPAVTDAITADPSLHIDWVADRRFAEVPSWHPGVQKIILSDHRNWRKSPFSRNSRSDFKNMLTELRKESYDLVIDAQGNFKTALLSLWIKAPSIGFDRKSIREKGADLFYRHTVSAGKDLHAIQRLRILLASALHYPVSPSFPDYGIDTSRFIEPDFPLPSRYLVFVPIASCPSKTGTREFWKELIAKAEENGHTIVLPFGSETERNRVSNLAKHSKALVLPRPVSLSEMGHILLHAEGTVASDTGLGHIAAALGKPSVSLYGPTDPLITGTVGQRQKHLCAPDCLCHNRKQCRLDPESACMKKLRPGIVLETLHSLL